MTVSFKFSESVVRETGNAYYDAFLGIAIQSLCYLVLYPLEMVQIRMAVDVESKRLHANIGDCVRKMMKMEGYKSFVRGVMLGLVNFASNALLIRQLVTQF